MRVCSLNEGCRTCLPFREVVTTTAELCTFACTVHSAYCFSHRAHSPGRWLLLTPLMLITQACRRSVLPKVTWLMRCQDQGQVTFLFPLYVMTPLTKSFFPSSSRVQDGARSYQIKTGTRMCGVYCKQMCLDFSGLPSACSPHAEHPPA